jgi:hypothetical protein
MFGQTRIVRSFVLLFVAFALSSCSDSPTDPGNDRNGDGGGTGFVDAPEIPEPSSPGGDVPNRSETLTRIEPLDGNFRARILDVTGSWRLEQVCASDSRLVDGREGFASEMLGTQYGSLARKLMGSIPDLVAANGEGLVVVDEDHGLFDCGGPFGLNGVEISRFQSPSFDADVYVRRDRHWALRPLEGGAGDYLLVYPNTQGEVSTSYESGSEQSRTEEFGRSITATLGVSYGVLSASVSATLSETFSSSVTVSQSTTETFTKTVTGKDDTVIQFMVWELVERYSFCDADGEAVSSERFKIQTGSMERRGVAIALKSTEFSSR